MDGEVLAINPLVRQAGTSFPGEGEWDWAYVRTSESGSLCGPLFSCGQQTTAQKVVIYSSPVVYKDLLLVGTYSGKVMAINRHNPSRQDDFPSPIKKGEWIFPKGDKYIGAIVGGLVLVDEILYFGSSDGKVYALDAVTGDSKWEQPFETQKRIWTSPTVSEGVVYVGSYDGKLYAISSRDGSQLWQSDLPAVMCSSPVIFHDTIYFGTFDRYLYAVKIADATIKWKFQGGNWFWAEPVVKGDTVYASCLDNKIYAINAATGTQIWQFTADKPIISRPVIVADLIVAASESGTLYLVDIVNGTPKKTVSIDYSVMAPLYAVENTVYIHARDDSVRAIDIQSGKELWKFKKASK